MVKHGKARDFLPRPVSAFSVEDLLRTFLYSAYPCEISLFAELSSCAVLSDNFLVRLHESLQEHYAPFVITSKFLVNRCGDEIPTILG